jgi:catechol 2,3-dioxygenase-like lactoylglutathione lyase family enzyme
MSRVQLALNVTDIDEAVAFYSKLFATEPAKRRPGYANFAIADPPLKLVLIEGEAGGTLNHLGVEMSSVDHVSEGLARIAGEGLPVRVEGEVTCCYALQDKGWTNDPDGAPWELYTVLADADVMHPEPQGCCAPTGLSV